MNEYGWGFVICVGLLLGWWNLERFKKAVNFDAKVARRSQPLLVENAAGNVSRTASSRENYEDADVLNAHASFHKNPSWVDALIHAFHILVVGQTRGGKTVLVHHIAGLRAATDEVYVIDPDARPGMWPGARTVAGSGDDWEEVSDLLGKIAGLISTRRSERREGQRKFSPVTLVISELGDVMTNVPEAREIFEDVVRRGGKLCIRLVADVQDNQVKTLKLEGASSLLINLIRVEVRKEGDKRIARVDNKDHIIPLLTDPEALADTAYENRLSSVSSGDGAGETSLVRSNGAVRAGIPPYVTSEAPVTGGDDLSDDIINALHLAGWSRNKIQAQMRKGSKQDRLARIRQVIGEEE